MSRIAHVATQLPPFRYDSAQIRETAAKWLTGRPQEFELFCRLTGGARIGARHFARPLEEIAALNGAGRRAEIFYRDGSELAARLLERMIDEKKLVPAEIGSLVFTSCSVPAIPSIDAALVTRFGFRPAVSRVPVFQFGCAGGAIGLSLAGRLAAPSKPALLLSVELCSLVYQPADFDGSSIIGSVLFADGAAGVVVEPGDSGVRILGSTSHLIADSTHLMGYDLLDDGMHLRLDRELPSALSREAPAVIRAFLAKHGLHPADVAWWLFHPGGVKVLRALEETMELRPAQSEFAWRVLHEHGNMSSASILFVLQDFLQSDVAAPGDYALMFGIGPGLTLELMLLRMER